jgi:hypothetical protein
VAGAVLLPSPTAGTGPTWRRATVARTARALGPRLGLPANSIGHIHRPHTHNPAQSRPDQGPGSGQEVKPRPPANHCEGNHLAHLGVQDLAGGRQGGLVASVDVTHRSSGAVDPELRGSMGQMRPYHALVGLVPGLVDDPVSGGGQAGAQLEKR